MSDASPTSALQPTSELVRWLQSLALPLWARGILVIVFIAVTAGGLTMVAWGMVYRDRETMTAAISLLTVALPVSLVVIGLVFGQRSEVRLGRLTDAVLETLIPTQVEKIAGQPRGMQLRLATRAGCRATYVLSPQPAQPQVQVPLRFSIELNVRKVNVMFSLPHALSSEFSNAAPCIPPLPAYEHVIAGAMAEGYRRNPALAHYGGEDGGTALLFFRALPEDFLLRPMERLYFAQDLGFFVRGVLEAQEAALCPLQLSGAAAAQA